MDITRDWILSAISENPGITRADLIRMALPEDADCIQIRRANEVIKRKLMSLRRWGVIIAEGEGSRWDPLHYRIIR